METETQSKYKPRIVKGRVRVPYGNGEIAFSHPSVPGDYRTAGKLILDKCQLVPTGDYTASLLHVAYGCTEEARKVMDELEFENVRETMRSNWLPVYNILTWTDKGVYSMKDLEALGLSDETGIAQLEKTLREGRELSWGGIRFSKDGREAFAPKGSYKLGNYTPESLAKDGLIVIAFVEEGAEKFGEVSGNKKYFKNNPRTWGVEVAEGRYPVKRVSAVGGGGGGLGFDGDCWLGVGYYRAFGVFAEALTRTSVANAPAEGDVQKIL